MFALHMCIRQHIETHPRVFCWIHHRCTRDTSRHALYIIQKIINILLEHIEYHTYDHTITNQTMHHGSWNAPYPKHHISHLATTKTIHNHITHNTYIKPYIKTIYNTSHITTAIIQNTYKTHRLNSITHKIDNTSHIIGAIIHISFIPDRQSRPSVDLRRLVQCGNTY